MQFHPKRVTLVTRKDRAHKRKTAALTPELIDRRRVAMPRPSTAQLASARQTEAEMSASPAPRSAADGGDQLVELTCLKSCR